MSRGSEYSGSNRNITGSNYSSSVNNYYSGLIVCSTLILYVFQIYNCSIIYALFSANEDLGVDPVQTGVLVSAVDGEKRLGDYIDEAILLG